MTPSQFIQFLRRDGTDILGEAEFEEKLRSGRRLRVKLGLDPTAKDVHLGWSVVINKLDEFRRAGHECFIIVGDFTASIGDPTGRNKSRPPLSDEEIEANYNILIPQLEKILGDTADNPVRIMFNGNWFEQARLSQVVTEMLSQVTVNQLIQREDFKNRLASGQPIFMHELVYPIFQAFDSAILSADVEIGGSDQRFNCLLGRDFTPEAPQTVVLCPLLRGTDGVQKMSQSIGNTIGITEPPGEQFGKTMSIPDNLMDEWFHVLFGFKPSDSGESLWRRKEAAIAGEGFEFNPKDKKRLLARMIVEKWHGIVEAERADAEFQRVFSQRQNPTDMQEVQIPVECVDVHGLVSVADLVAKLEISKSKSDAKRLIKGGAVSIDGSKIDDEFAKVELHKLDGGILTVGKRTVLRLRVENVLAQ